MAVLSLVKHGGMLFGADEKSKQYIKRCKRGELLNLNVTSPRKTRRNELNRLSHLMYNQAAAEKGTEPADEKAYCKYHFGIPTLINPKWDDWEITQEYYQCLLERFSYEQRIERMYEGKFYVPVTSLMTDDQIHDYINRCVRHYGLTEGISVLLPPEIEQLQKLARP